MTINMIGISLAVAAVILGAWALLGTAGWRWFLLAAGLFSALAAMAVGINAEWLAALDTSVENWFVAHRSPRWEVDAAGIFRFVGSPVHVASVALVCGGLLSWQARSAIPVFLVAGGVGVGVALEQMLKAAVEHTSTAVAELRHYPPHTYEHTFPSGHVTGAAALLGMIAVCLGVGRSRATKVTLAVPVVAGVLFVAFIAVYCKAHTFSDVVGGMFLGGAIVTLGGAVLAATTTSRRTPEAADPADNPSPSYT